MSVTERDIPPLAPAIAFACALSVLLYVIIGGVGVAGFSFGPVKMSGSAAVLIGSVWIFNYLLEPQMNEIRQERVDVAVNKAKEAFSFDYERHVTPPKDWYAISRITGEPVEIQILDPTGIRRPKVIDPPREPGWNLEMGEMDESNRYPVFVRGATVPIGYMSVTNIEQIFGNLATLEPAETHGPVRLHLVRAGELPPDKPRSWGLDECVENLLPIQIYVERFYEDAAVYQVRPCDGGDPIRSSLGSGEANTHKFTINGEDYAFVVTVVAADHQTEPFWSSFLVIEMRRDKK